MRDGDTKGYRYIRQQVAIAKQGKSRTGIDEITGNWIDPLGRLTRTSEVARIPIAELRNDLIQISKTYEFLETCTLVH